MSSTEQTSAWLVAGDTVLASLEVATDRRSRMQGLLGRDSMNGALLLQPARSVHTIGMRFAIDVAFVSRELDVLDIVTMVPNRVGRPRWHARAVVEAPAGAFARWKVSPGDRLEIR
ncbi:MAG: DUF192 domain-containing protein [Actinobacteria bacterium]|nr:DUF192 domain-containing protein [Actinomycetota bacterium]